MIGKSVIKKLMEIQQELKVPKSQRNTFGNYNFRNCEDIMEASKPICKKYNCVLICSDELIQINERYYVKATATLYDIETGESISATSEAREEETKKGMDSSQITGASSSYARKYALNGLLQLDDNKDADTNEYTKVTKTETKATKGTTKPAKKDEEPANPKTITDAQKKLINTLLSKQEDREQAKKDLYAKFNITTIKGISSDLAKQMIESLKGDSKGENNEN